MKNPHRPNASRLSLLLAPWALASATAAGDLVDVTPLAYDETPTETVPFGPVHYWAGAAWGDVDGDGFPDLFLTDYYGPNRLYMNEPSAPGSALARTLTFAPGAIDGDAAGAGEGAVFADLDNDGDLDLYVANQGGSPNKLYANVGGSFVDVSAGSGVDSPDFGEGVCAGDVDGDGLVDLFLTNFGDPSDPSNPGAPNALFLNTGGMTFADATAESGISTGIARSSACALVDWDGDGDLDLTVGNSGAANELYTNDGSGGFTLVTSAVGGAALEDSDAGTFGLRWFDADADGDLDLYVSNSVYGPSAPDSGNKLFLSGLSAGSPTLTLAPAGAESPLDSMSVSACDLNLDRELDLAVANFGTNEGFLGTPGVGFAPTAIPEPFPDVTSSATSCDYDRDGDVDLFFGGMGTVFVYENLGDAGKGSTAIRFSGGTYEDSPVPADGSGTQVQALVAKSGTPGLLPTPRMVVDSGSGYAQDDAEALVGLDLATESLAELHVSWMDGAKETLFGVPAHAPGALRSEVLVEYPAGIEPFGTQSYPEPIALWRGDTAGTFSPASLGEPFTVSATSYAPGSTLILIIGLTPISLPISGGDLLVLPIDLALGAEEAPGVTSWEIPIPASVGLEGAAILFQSVAVLPGGGYGWSGGLAATVQA